MFTDGYHSIFNPNNFLLNTRPFITMEQIDNSGFLSSIETKNPINMTIEEKRAAVLENNKKLAKYKCKKIKDTGPTLPKIDPDVIMEELGAEEIGIEEKANIINNILSYGTDEDVKNLVISMNSVNHGDCPDFPEPPAKHESLWKKIKKYWL